MKNIFLKHFFRSRIKNPLSVLINKKYNNKIQRRFYYISNVCYGKPKYEKIKSFLKIFNNEEEKIKNLKLQAKNRAWIKKYNYIELKNKYIEIKQEFLNKVNMIKVWAYLKFNKQEDLSIIVSKIDWNNLKKDEYIKSILKFKIITSGCLKKNVCHPSVDLIVFLNSHYSLIYHYNITHSRSDEIKNQIGQKLTFSNINMKDYFGKITNEANAFVISKNLLKKVYIDNVIHDMPKTVDDNCLKGLHDHFKQLLKQGEIKTWLITYSGLKQHWVGINMKGEKVLNIKILKYDKTNKALIEFMLKGNKINLSLSEEMQDQIEKQINEMKKNGFF